ncbi:DUF6087 family protein [Streptomyces sp. NPDC012769]|uniref:DUF6087 family protein n=1 Tax=Streptomyces sp. NPDC012769 TaxID=3364848 RepID=UPI0036A6C91C
MSDEPLEDWARRWDERRTQSRGRLRHVSLTTGPQRGWHIDPGAPRVIEQWDGYAWVPVQIVPDLASAQRMVHPPQPAAQRPVEWDRPPLGKNKPGRHRRE